MSVQHPRRRSRRLSSQSAPDQSAAAEANVVDAAAVEDAAARKKRKALGPLTNGDNENEKGGAKKLKKKVCARDQRVKFVLGILCH